MFSGQAFIIFVTFDNLGNVVDVVLRRVRIVFECMQFFMFWHLGDELF